IRYEPVAPPPRWKSPYSGKPSEVIDQAWHNLLENMNIRVTEDELEQNNQESIFLPQGDHCFELLRTAAMCHGDTTLTTFYWGDQNRPEPDVRFVPYRCVNWDALMNSVNNRIVTTKEMWELVNPELP
ncbi:hypothetical protein BJ878DRAFT_558282, partial [Calycina marina]